MPGNERLRAAKDAKQDEFYTQYEDIQKEMKHYRHHFKGKTVFCNCDDPFESNFFKYFALAFNKLGLKKLIATSYKRSPIAGTQLRYRVGKNGQMTVYFGEEAEALRVSENEENETPKPPYLAIVTSVHDATGNGGVEMVDIAELLKSGENKVMQLQGDGDFRSPECLALLDEADIVVTNPPFSLFREYIATLIEHDKKFIIIGNKNSINYKEVFPLLKENKLWIGHRNINDDMWFVVPDGYEYEKIENGKKIKHIMGCWFTNLDLKKCHEELVLFRRYSPEKYPKYDNYDAINVDKTTDIPKDYSGLMGVPITFMDKYNPDQFEILGLSNVEGLLSGVGIIGEKWITDYRASGGTGHLTANMRSLVGYKADGKPISYYARIIIRNKHPEKPKEVRL